MTFSQILAVDYNIILEQQYDVYLTVKIGIEVNQAPYFETWDESLTVEVVAGDKAVTQDLPPIIDPEGDSVDLVPEISYGLDFLAYSIELSSNRRSIIFDYENLNLHEIGLNQTLVHIQITLDDGHEREEQPQYTLVLYLTQKIIETESTNLEFEDQQNQNAAD